MQKRIKLRRDLILNEVKTTFCQLLNLDYFLNISYNKILKDNCLVFLFYLMLELSYGGHTLDN